MIYQLRTHKRIYQISKNHKIKIIKRVTYNKFRIFSKHTCNGLCNTFARNNFPNEKSESKSIKKTYCGLAKKAISKLLQV